MSKDFWQKLKQKKKGKPIYVLAPMADVTDFAFRKMIAKYGKPDVMWTEFVSADGLVLAPEPAKQHLLKDLKFDRHQRPIIAQIFSANPEHMKQVAQLIQQLGFDGLDINMGCPDRSVEKQLSGSAMIKNPDIAVEVIKAAQEGAPNLPISVKTRLGYNQDQLEEWLPLLLETKVQLITIHARTRKDLSKVPARWERIKRIVEIRDEIQKDLSPKERTLIFGNGDVVSLADASKKAIHTGCDGIMVGRGVFGKPWFFSHKKEPNLKKRLQILIKHAEMFDKYVPHKNFAVMRKHFKAYVEGFEGAKELRIQLMVTQNAKEVKKIVKNFIKEYC